MRKKILFTLLIALTGCSSYPDTAVIHQWQEIAARNDANSLYRPLIYRAMVADNWERIDIDPAFSLSDTTKAVCEYWIQEGGSKIRVTIHTFPINDSSLRVPPTAQIARWKDQFEELNPLLTSISTESHGGFTGLCLEAEGIYQNAQTTMMGWSMQLALEFERPLSLHREPKDQYKLADFTIKAVGETKIVEKYKPDIKCFAQSFELIDELPPPI